MKNNQLSLSRFKKQKILKKGTTAQVSLESTTINLKILYKGTSEVSKQTR
jgi:hypothetical protein